MKKVLSLVLAVLMVAGAIAAFASCGKKEEVKPITSIADLAGKVVTVQKESSGQKALDKDADLVATFKGGKYELCADYTAAFNDLTAGAVDAIVIDIGVANSLIEGKTGYAILSEPLAVEQYGVGFKKGNTELRNLVNDAMIKLADKAKEIAKVYNLEDSIKIEGTPTGATASDTTGKVLKLGFDAEYPPYGYLDTETNTYKGFDLDFAKEVCKEIGYELELIPIDWDAKDLELNSGNIDCIWSGFTIQGREDQYEWTVPYSDSSIVVLVKTK